MIGEYLEAVAADLLEGLARDYPRLTIRIMSDRISEMERPMIALRTAEAQWARQGETAVTVWLYLLWDQHATDTGAGPVAPIAEPFVELPPPRTAGSLPSAGGADLAYRIHSRLAHTLEHGAHDVQMAQGIYDEGLGYVDYVVTWRTTLPPDLRWGYPPDDPTTVRDTIAVTLTPGDSS